MKKYLFTLKNISILSFVFSSLAFAQSKSDSMSPSEMQKTLPEWLEVNDLQEQLKKQIVDSSGNLEPDTLVIKNVFLKSKMPDDSISLFELEFYITKKGKRYDFKCPTKIWPYLKASHVGTNQSSDLENQCKIWKNGKWTSDPSMKFLFASLHFSEGEDTSKIPSIYENETPATESETSSHGK